LGSKLTHDICVANRIVNGRQLTVTFHVDDLKVSHKEKTFVDEFIEWLRLKYEDEKVMNLAPRGRQLLIFRLHTSTEAIQ
jgi:hypothetical protein